MTKAVVLSAACAVILLFAANGCKKNEQPVSQMNAAGQQMPAGHPGMDGQPGQNVTVPKGEIHVIVPDSVKGKWKAVVLQIDNKETKKTGDFTVNLNSELLIPNSNLKVVVGDFLPDFTMSGLDVTSKSNDPDNPAVAVRIFEGSNQVFPAPGKKWAWFFGRPELRSLHPFESPKYGIVLKTGVRKG
jgi:hypothetical protein